MRVTPRQIQLLSFIDRHQSNHGMPPTTREICEHFRWASTNAAFDAVRALQRKGLLYSREGRLRLRRAPLELSATARSLIGAAVTPYTLREFDATEDVCIDRIRASLAMLDQMRAAAKRGAA